MSIQVQGLYNEVCSTLLEDTGLTALGIMSTADFFNMLNDVYQDFLSRTACIKAQFDIAIVAATAVYTEPDRAMDVQMVTANGVYLARSSGWYLDNYQPSWPSDAGNPERWREDGIGPKKIQIEPTPTASVGNIELTASAQPTSYPAVLTDNFNWIPDSFVWILKYGLLAKAWSGDGEYKDLTRAAFARSRYLEGASLIGSIMSEVVAEET